MKTKKFILLSYLSYFLTGSLCAAETSITTGTENTQKTAAVSVKGERKIWFNCEKEPLYRVINRLAALQYNPLTREQGITVIHPTGPNALTAELTFSLPHQVTPETAWRYLLSILNIAGYTIEPGKTFSSIKKIDKNISREPLPFFVNVKASELPPDDTEIIYLRYLKNIQVPGGNNSSTSLQTVLQNYLSPNATFFFDPQTNGVIIIDVTTNIKYAMEIIDVFDNAHYWDQEPLILPLKYVSASQVKALFDDIIPQQNPATKASNYFAQDTKFIVESRKNMLIILGKSESLQRIKEFIKTHIDIPLGKGKSILHIATLKYQKAEVFAPILQQIVQDQSTSSSGQSTGSSGAGNPQQFFKGVIIQPEVPSSSGDTSSGSVQGGNRLIIAATENDWTRIKNLIETLDKPQPQIILKGLIADMTNEDQRAFGNQLRNYTNMFLQNVNWQSGHISGIETNTAFSTPSNPNSPTNSESLRANLLGPSSSVYPSGNIASNATAGSFIMSFADTAGGTNNGIFLVTQILSEMTNSNILYQPFLVTTNNTPVTFQDTSTQKIPGQASERFGVEVQEQQFQDATTSVTCTPRISQNGTVNLTLVVNIQQWTGVDNGQTTRSFTTNVNIKSGDILVIGGMTKNKIENSIAETPLLARIPVLGSLFRNQSRIITTTNLMTFFQVEVINPTQKRDPISDQIFAAAGKAINPIDEETFAQLRDPISRWFFGSSETDALPEQSLRVISRQAEPIVISHKTPSVPTPHSHSSSESTMLAELKRENSPMRGSLQDMLEQDKDLAVFFKKQQI